MTARFPLATIATATALAWAGCAPAPHPTSTAPTGSYSARTEGPPTALLSHLEALEKRYAAADHRDLDAFRADLRAYSDAAVATADALIDRKDTPDGIRRQAAEAKLDALVRRIEADPKGLDLFLAATDRLEREPKETGLPALVAYRRVRGIIEAYPLDSIDDPTLDRLIVATEHLGQLDPPDPGAAPLLLDVAKAAERHHKTEGARKLYALFASRFPDDKSAKYAAGSVQRLENLAKPLENFAGKSLRDDATIDLADFRGKVVLVDFWASWCTPCLHQMPALKALRDRLSPEGFEILGVCLDEDPSTPRLGIKRYGLDWPHIRAFEGAKAGDEPAKDLSTRFGVETIPFMMVIDREGRYVASGNTLPDVLAAISELFPAASGSGK